MVSGASYFFPAAPRFTVSFRVNFQSSWICLALGHFEQSRASELDESLVDGSLAKVAGGSAFAHQAPELATDLQDFEHAGPAGITGLVALGTALSDVDRCP